MDTAVTWKPGCYWVAVRRVVGAATLRAVDHGNPRALFGRHGGLGAWNLNDLAKAFPAGRATAFIFDFFEPLQAPVALEVIRKIHPKFNPITSMMVERQVGDAILMAGAPK